jgi:hypothetical protein
MKIMQKGIPYADYLSNPSNPLNELLAALAGSKQGISDGKFGLHQVQNSGELLPGISELS